MHNLVHVIITLLGEIDNKSGISNALDNIYERRDNKVKGRWL